MDARLLDILVCPICKANLEYRKQAAELVLATLHSGKALDRVSRLAALSHSEE